MGVLSGLEPKGVFRWFEELAAIPHGSRNTRAVSDWLADFARARGLRFRQDGADNVIIWKAASPGYEDAPTVMLQGHMDMVCEKAPDCEKDMAREGLALFLDGDEIGARGSTLGADDGIAVAMALAVLDDDSLPHGPLECGVLLGKMPWLDCISFAPDLIDIHTPCERLRVASTQRTWALLLETLRRLR